MKITVLIWLMAATVLAGTLVLIVLVVPNIGTVLRLGEAATVTIAALLGAVIAVPVSVGVTRSIVGGRNWPA